MSVSVIYSDYTIDDVLQTVSCFVQSIDETWEELSHRHKTVETLYFNHLKEIFKNKALQQASHNLINNEYKKLDDFSSSLEKNKVHLQGLKDNVAKLQEIRREKEKQLSKLEKDVSKVRKKIEYTLDDKEDIEEKKDIVLTYKLITNTSFVYTNRQVTGIVAKNPPKTFTFNPQNVSQEEITQTLWQLVLEGKK